MIYYFSQGDCVSPLQAVFNKLLEACDFRDKAAVDETVAASL